MTAFGKSDGDGFQRRTFTEDHCVYKAPELMSMLGMWCKSGKECLLVDMPAHHIGFLRYE